MWRSAFLFLSGRSWLRHWMETSPLSTRFTSRFIAGRTLAEGLRVARQLASERIATSLDFLGENVTSLDEAARCRAYYLDALREIAAGSLPATVSIKLTQFGLDLSEQVCSNNVAALVEAAAQMGSRVEIDMESSDYTDRTLRIVTAMQARFPGHVRAVIQAYLYRSEADIGALSEQGIPVRLCKGAYSEGPEVAHQEKADVDRNYVKLMQLLFERGVDPAIATHDERMVNECLDWAARKNIVRDRFEFQMLYGIRRDLQKKLSGRGFRLRSYVPYGEAWYPYFMRRLAERPANVLFVARNLMRG